MTDPLILPMGWWESSAGLVVICDACGRCEAWYHYYPLTGGLLCLICDPGDSL